MKKIIIVFVFLTSLFCLSCSSEPTEPEEVNLEVWSLAFGSSNQVFATASVGLCQSLDGGETWECINSKIKGGVSVSPSGTIYSMKVESDGLETTKQTLIRSTDGGKTFIATGWIRNHIYITGGMNWLAFNKQGHLFAQEHGYLYRSTSSGQSWEILNNITLGWFYLRNPPLIAPDDLFIHKYDGVYRSEDNGDNWIQVFGLQDISGDTAYSHDALAFNSQGRIFVAINVSHQEDSVETGIIYYSDDNGNNWIKSASLNSHITNLAVNIEDKIFAITKQSEVFYSLDNGIQWDKVSMNFPKCSVTKFLISPDKKLFIRTMEEHYYYRSQDDGVTWERYQLHL